MTLNISNPVQSKSSVGGFSQSFLSKNNITVNQPAQTHFSVEGVQTYSADEIKALLRKAERVDKGNRDGQFVKPQAYKIAQKIQFDNMPEPTTGFNSTLRPKSAKNGKLQPAKLEEQVKKKPIKPSIRNQLARTNQKAVKLEKRIKQKSALQNRLKHLTEKYKKHFGSDFKLQDESKAEQAEDQGKQPQQQIEQLEVEEQQGEQCLPQTIKNHNVTTTAPKTKQQQEQHDDFEKSQVSKSSRRSRLSEGTYIQKLGNAISSLF